MKIEILFRGKRSHNPKVGQWVYGDLMSKELNFKICPSIGWSFAVDKETVGQFVGAKDKCNIKIFEGDIVTSSKSGVPNNMSITGVVEYEPQALQWWIKWTEKKDSRTIHKYQELHKGGQFGDDNGIQLTGIEIIGNIYDDKDLLK